MRQDFFTYVPQFKLVLAGNHKPSLRSVDEAIRRRFHLVPFTVTIPKEERDKDLPEKLRAEWPGILQWAIDGCLEWQGIGLAPPAAVLAATEDYLSSEDAIGQWLEECCAKDQIYAEPIATLFASWSGWAEKANERPGSKKAFVQAVIDRGFERGFNSTKTERVIFGIGLR
jgi:putative DNA primase/helicase